MTPKREISIETIATICDNCDISAEVVDDEVRFILGPSLDGLRLDFAWPGLIKFMCVAEAIIDRRRRNPRGRPLDFMVSADERSRLAHTPQVSRRTTDDDHLVL